MSTLPISPPRQRHALGMPAGSVRAMLAFCVLLYLWLMLLAPTLLNVQVGAPEAFIYMNLVMVMALAHFMGAHGRTIGAAAASQHSPLWMPRGTIRILLLIGYFGMVYYSYQKYASADAQATYSKPDLEPLILVTALVMATWLLGHGSSNVMRWLAGGTLPYWFLDVQAWIALVSLVLLIGVIIVRLVINPTVSDTSQLTLKYTEPTMAALVAFYFGARS